MTDLVEQLENYRHHFDRGIGHGGSVAESPDHTVQFELDEGDLIMVDIQKRETDTDHPDEKTQRRWLPYTILAAAAVIIVVIGAIALFGGTEESSEVDVVDSPLDVEAPEPTEQVTPESDEPSPDESEAVPLPDFAVDPLLVGEALTSAWASGNGDLFLSLFAPDAIVTEDNSDPVTGDEILRPDRGYAAVMGETWEWTDCQPLGSGETASTRCEAVTTNAWLALVDREPYLGVATITSDAGQIVEYKYQGFGTDRDTITTLSRFRNWTLENHPDEAAMMWTNDPFEGAPNETEESARLHLRLGAEFVEECTSNDALDC